jgi:hypothetical protein
MPKPPSIGRYNTGAQFEYPRGSNKIDVMHRF